MQSALAGRARLPLWFCLIAAAFSLIQLSQVTARASPDTTQYVSYSLMLSGHSREQAAADTMRFFCASRQAQAAEAARLDVREFDRPQDNGRVYARCLSQQQATVRAVERQGGVSGYMSLFSSPRMSAIYVGRPGYAVFLVPYIAVFGIAWGLWAAAVTVTVAAAALVVALLRTSGATVPVALAGEVLYFVTPIGGQAMRPLSEGLMLVGVAAVALGCVRVLHGREPSLRWVWCAVAGFALTAVTKYSQALLLAGCLVAVLLAVLLRQRLRRRPVPRGIPVLIVLGVAVAVGVQLAVQALQLPSGRESMQDLLTSHFTVPDVASPWRGLLLLDRNFWIDWTRRQFVDPLTTALLLGGVWGVWRGGRVVATIAFTLAGAGILNQAGHPLVGEGLRLMVLTWFLPVIGLPLLWMDRRSQGPRPDRLMSRQSGAPQPREAPQPGGLGVGAGAVAAEEGSPG
jgi:hypothetical protein